MKHFYLFLVGLSPFLVFGQSIDWEKTIGGNKSEYLHDMKATPDFGFILAGSSFSEDSGNKTEKGKGDLDYFLWKMDEEGREEWQKSFGGSGSDHLYCVNLTYEGGYILGGSSNSPKSGDKKDENYGLDDFWVLKLNPAGEEEWQFTLGGKGQDILLSIQETPDHGFILGGTSDSGIGENSAENPYEKAEACRGSMDFWVIKLSENGAMEWQRSLGGSYYDLLRAIQIVPDGYLLGGYSNSPVGGDKTEESQGVGDFWLIKLDLKGEELWQKTLGGDGDDQLYALTVSEEAIYLGGSSNSSEYVKSEKDRPNTDYLLFKLDLEGEMRWVKNYDLGKTDLLSAMQRTRSGNLILGGYALSETYGEGNDRKGIDDYWVQKIDTEGKVLWKKTLGGKQSDRLQNVVVSRDGGYILAGTSDSGKGRDKEAAGQGRDDYWIVKLRDQESEIGASQLLELYPNPATDYVNVLFHKDLEQARLQVVDLSGAVVLETELHQRLTPLGIQQLQTGVYIIQIETENEKFNSKLIKK